MVKCAKCIKTVTKRSPGLQCSKCNKWFHGDCTDISSDQLNTLYAMIDVDWKCRACAGTKKPKRLSCILPEPDCDEDESAPSDQPSSDIVKKVLEEIREKIQEIVARELQSTLHFYSEKIDEYEQKMKANDNNVKSLQNQCNDLQNKCKNLDLKNETLEVKINLLEQSQIANQIEVCGLDVKENENVMDIANTICTKLNQSTDNIIKAYRKKRASNQGQSTPKSPPAITICLRDGCQERWLSSAKSTTMTSADVGGLGARSLFIREALTPFTSYLLWKTKMDLKNTELCKYVWYKNGNIMVRKSDGDKLHFVRSTKDVERLITTFTPKQKKKRGRPKKLPKPKLEYKEERQVCEECGKSVKNLKEHSLQHRPREERKMLRCKECPKVFITLAGRKRHYKATHLGLRSKCDICNKEFRYLPVHKLQVHNPQALPYGCLLCPRRFITQSALDFHVLSHTRDYPLECDTCHKKFRSKNFLSRHIRQVHDKETRYQCHLCSKGFFTREHLKRHMRVHTNERPYCCEECGNAFADKRTLKNHLLIHFGVKSFRCKVCDMTFMRSGYLKVHMLSHTKEKNHPCRYCGVRFGRSDHRNRHEFTAHRQHAG